MNINQRKQDSIVGVEVGNIEMNVRSVSWLGRIDGGVKLKRVNSVREETTIMRRHVSGLRSMQKVKRVRSHNNGTFKETGTNIWLEWQQGK